MIELNKIYNMDCLEGMKMIPDNSVDFVLTDPPYVFTPHGGGSSGLAQRSKRKQIEIEFIANDFDYNACFEEFLRVLKIPNLMIFCSNKQVGRTMTWFENKGLTATLLVWQKTNPAPLGNMNYISDIEFIVYVRDKGSVFNADVPLEWKRKVYTSPIHPDGCVLHPTQKSVQHLRRYILTHTKPNDVVLDAFMGSGTTAIACIKEKRNFIGFEINNEYYEKSLKRIEDEQRQLTLF